MPIYRRLFGAQVLSLTGTGLSSVALALLAYELAGDDAGVVLGTALAIKMVAYIGIAPIVGGIVHRLPRKALLIALDAMRTGTVLLFPFVDAVWQVYGLIFILNAGSAAFTPTFQAAIPDVLPNEARYTRALSLSRLAYDLENLLSPLLAAVLLTVVSFDALFMLNALGFVASGLLVLSVTLPAPQPSDRPAGVWLNIAFGVRAYLAARARRLGGTRTASPRASPSAPLPPACGRHRPCTIRIGRTEIAPARLSAARIQLDVFAM